MFQIFEYFLAYVNEVHAPTDPMNRQLKWKSIIWQDGFFERFK